ncbi:SURF1 family protein [Glacieibacterium sp.]|uniref:SURF1 family protein n=1 Tax=Glacieibacterium sp. TaxID=2860237 RepID=UPI003B00FBFE
MTLIMVVTMVGLGIWQLERRVWKHQLIAQLEAAAHLPPVRPVEFFRAMVGEQSVQFRRATIDCRPGRVVPYDMRGGDSKAGEPGFLVLIACRDPAFVHGRGPDLVVAAGWTNRPEAPTPLVVDTEFSGTVIEHAYGKDPKRPFFMLIPDTAIAPLVPARQPTPGDLPDSHLSYAFQWFAFATTLTVIYGIFMWRRLKSPADAPIIGERAQVAPRSPAS